MSDEINIKSSTIEKGLELAKEFIGKLIGPSAEELGLFLSDNIKYLRYKNQIRILLKARKYVQDRNISTKEIPLKILVPLLENSSLEENEELQEKWAVMITNLCDSDFNLQSQIFPYILSQISKEEFHQLKILGEKENSYIKDKNEYWSYIYDNSVGEILPNEIKILEKKLTNVEQEGFILPFYGFQKANMLRLGIVKELPPTVEIIDFRPSNDKVGSSLSETKYANEDIGYRITELGKSFLKICQLSTKNPIGKK
jgi:hypothetical protein